MTTQRTTDVADPAAPEADDRSAAAEAWPPVGIDRDIDSGDRLHERRPLVDYFERMRERGLLD